MKNLVRILIINCSLPYFCTKEKNNGFISLPSNLKESGLGMNLSCDEFKKIFHDKMKIVAVINSDCSVCHSEIWEWERLIKKHHEFSEVPIVFILFGSEFNLPERLYRSTVFNNFSFFLDKEKQFYRLNCLSADKSLSAFLLDSNWRIVSPGNPIYSEAILNNYLSVVANTNSN